MQHFVTFGYLPEIRRYQINGYILKSENIEYGCGVSERLTISFIFESITTMFRAKEKKFTFLRAEQRAQWSIRPGERGISVGTQFSNRMASRQEVFWPKAISTDCCNLPSVCIYICLCIYVLKLSSLNANRSTGQSTFLLHRCIIIQTLFNKKKVVLFHFHDSSNDYLIDYLYKSINILRRRTQRWILILRMESRIVAKHLKS